MALEPLGCHIVVAETDLRGPGNGHQHSRRLSRESQPDKKATTPSWPGAPAPFPRAMALRAPKEFCRSLRGLHPEFLGLQVECAELGLGAPEMVLWAPERASQSLRAA